VRVHERRARYLVAGCQAERTVVEADGHRTTTIAAESVRPTDVLAAIEAMGLRDYCNLDVPAGLRLHVDRVPERYAVIDAGTKLDQVAHRRALDTVGSPPAGSEVTLHHKLVRVVDDLARHAGQADILRESIDGAAGLTPTNLNLPDTSQIDWPAYVVKLTQIARSFPESSPSTFHRHAQAVRAAAQVRCLAGRGAPG
jgi:hypothetical protein